ncbi:MAG: LytTR family DNA-binding domain-containing protein [Flavobacteriales bacterium]|jgi:two-component system LytT family response regulator|nr:LytTR family DNA-binding domain-containing protein [Flavobacteriales bacterium]
MPHAPPITAVIVDDEAHCREALTGLLQQHFPAVDVRGAAVDVAGALELVRHEKPALLFLDVELGDRTGFDLLEALGDERPHVIFTTAHEGYAVKAIRFSALDFLLKPIDPDELRAALDKVGQRAHPRQRPDQFIALMRNMLLHAHDGERIALPVADGLEMVEVGSILRCESDGNYTHVHVKGGKPLLIARTLKEFEDLLTGRGFIRVHHAHLINVRHVRRYVRGEGGEVIMDDGTSVMVSRRKKRELMDGLERL